MKKNLFEIKTEEVQRILSLHEERSKNQYLTVINEQDNKSPNVVLDADYILIQGNQLSKGDGYLLQGTKFEPTSDPSIIKATNVNVNLYDGTKWYRGGLTDVTYYCTKEKFGIWPFFRSATNKKAADKVKTLCNRVNYESEIAKSGKTFKQNYAQQFYKDGGTTFQIVNGTVWTWDGKKATAKNITSGGIVTSGIDVDGWKNSLGDPSFSCTPNTTGTYLFGSNTYNVSDSEYRGNFGQLTNDLRAQFCFSKKEKQQLPQQAPQQLPQKSNFTALYTIQYPHDLGDFKILSGDTIIKSSKKVDNAAIMRGNSVITYYNCKTNTWESAGTTDTKGALTVTIKDKVCPQILTPVVDSTKTQTVNPDRQQQFIQKTVAGIMKVQQSLKLNQTGQLKNSDIDNIISKLQ